MLHRSMRAPACLAVVALIAAGCSSGDGVADPNQDDQLAIEFDGLSRDANGRGDGDAGAAFSGAAMALRLGIRPSDVTVSLDGANQTYSAFVHVVSHPRAGSTVTLRTLVAFRIIDGRPRDVLFLALTRDSLDFVAPPSARPDASGLSSWRDGSARQFYLATRGYGVLDQESRAGACPKVPSDGRVTCTVADFGLRLEGGYHALAGNQRGQIDPNRQVVIKSRASGVNGAVLTFN